MNSDGNLTFTAADNASTDRSLGRMTAGPPRISPLFDDLDPAADRGRRARPQRAGARGGQLGRGARVGRLAASARGRRFRWGCTRTAASSSPTAASRPSSARGGHRARRTAGNGTALVDYRNDAIGDLLRRGRGALRQHARHRHRDRRAAILRDARGLPTTTW